MLKKRIPYLLISPILGIVLTSVLVFFLDISPVQANTLSVDTLLDNQNDGCHVNGCTLREAINDAVDGDTVTFDASLASGSITLNGTELSINKALKIQANVPISVSGNNASRVFNVGSNGIVTLTGLTVRDGYVSGDGGGIYNQGELRLEGTGVINNEAQRGGGLANLSGTVTLSDTQVSNNSSTWGGGGLYVDDMDAVLTMIDGEIRDNASNLYGGGVFVYSGTANLSGTLVSGNGADEGGGLYVDVGTASLNKAVVSDNSANDSGGGLYVYTGMAAVSNAQIAENDATNGGGLYVLYGSAALSNTEIISNEATSFGGGVYMHTESTTIHIDGGTVSHNASLTNDGGGIYVREGNALLDQVLVAENSAGDWGGGIGANGGSVTLNDTQLFSNTARDGGGLFVYSAVATLTDTLVVSNTVTEYGGGVYVSQTYAELIMDNGQVNGNTAATRGGGLYVDQGHAKLSGTSIFENWTEWYGGGIAVWTGSAELSEVQVYSNTTDEYGGGVSAIYGDAFITDTHIYHNLAYEGGGLYLSDGNAVLSDTQIVSNTANSAGGGVYLEDAPAVLTMDGGQVYDNWSEDGGGVYVDEGNITLRNMQVTENVTLGFGGGMYLNPDNAILSNIQVVGNTSEDEGGGIYFDGETLTMTDSIIEGNTAVNDGGGLYADGPSTISNTIFQYNVSGDDGGGIYNRRNMELAYSTVYSNTASNQGGGIYQNSDISIIHSTVSENHATAHGGGLESNGSGSYIGYSTFSGNTANALGGAISNHAGELKLFNSTLSGNYATNGGGAIRYRTSSGDSILTHVTIANNNSGDDGESLVIASGVTVTTENSILSSSGEMVCSRVMVSQGFNLNSDDSCGLDALGDLVDTDPMLKPLADNGGETETHYPLPYNPIIDYISEGENGCGLTYLDDQRDSARPVNGACDIGAVESDIYLPPMVVDDVYTTTENMSLTVSAPGVLANDSGSDADLLTATMFSAPQNGMLSLNLDGSFIYTPTTGFYGLDSFVYIVSDGVLTDTGNVTITVDSLLTRTLTVSVAGAGSGQVTSDPAGIACTTGNGGDCEEIFNVGTVVTLTAVSGNDSAFKEWNGACSGTGSCQVTMTGDLSVTAVFAPSYSVYLPMIIKSP